MKPRRLALAKLTPPTLPHVIERTRLFRLLDQATKSPLTWIAAPPGSGKTTLLASYLKKRARKILWYRLDAGDADISSVFHYLGVAVQAAAPRFRQRLPHLTPEYLAGLPIFTQRFFEQLGSRFRKPFLLVFDNYQEVEQKCLLHQLFPLGIQQLPAHVRVVVLSREGLPNTYVRLQAERQVRLIQAIDLELTRDEARKVYRLYRDLDAKKVMGKIIDRFWQMTKGWMMGFILLLEQSKEQKAAVNLTAGENLPAVFEYLAGEVMIRFPPKMQRLLLTMSVVPDFTPDMATKLSGIPEAAQILEQLHRSRYFIERREDRLGWYRYHPLFREFLERRAQREFDSATVQRLRQSAAGLLVKDHSEDDAVSLLQEAGAWDLYQDLIRRQAPILMQQGRIDTIEKWIKRLPDSERAADPWMDFWLARCRSLIDPKESCSLYETAFRKFLDRGDREGMLLAWAGVVQAIILSWSGMSRIEPWVRRFEEIHPTGTPFPSLEVEAVVADAMSGAYVQMYQDQPQARQWLDRTFALSEHLPPSSRYMTDIYYLWFDDFPKAQSTMTHLRSKIERGDTSVGIRILYCTVCATLTWFTGEGDRCRQFVQEALALAEASGLLIWNGLIFAQGAYNELLVGNVKEARTFLDGMKPMCTAMGGIHQSQFLYLETWADLIEGNIEDAWKHVQEGQPIWEVEKGPVYPRAFTKFVDAQVLYARGRQDEARRLLEGVEVFARAIGNSHLMVGIYMLRAQWAFEKGEEAHGISALQQALAYGQKTRLLGFAGWVPHAAAALLAKALALQIEVPYVVQLIRRRQLLPPQDGIAPEAWPWRVRIRTLGSFNIEIDSHPLPMRRKAPHRLLDLLAAIVAFGGQEVPVSLLTDTMWPEVDGDMAQQNFKKSMMRLRHLLGIEDVIQWQAGKVSLNRALCWVDACAFEATVKQGEGRAATARSNANAHYESRTVALYTGPFLGLEDCPSWAAPYRDRLRDGYIKLIIRQCEVFNTTRKAIHVVRCLEQAIEVDPVTEPLYQRLIPLLVADGRHAEAASMYRRCKSALARWADRQPSPETQRLLQRLQPR